MTYRIGEQSKSARVVKVIAEQLGVEKDFIATCDNLRAKTGMDSLDEVELLMALEDEFGIEIQDEDAEKWASTADVIAFIEAHPEAA